MLADRGSRGAVTLVGHERLIVLRTSRRRRCCASPPSDDRLRCCPSTPLSVASVSGQDSCDCGRTRSRATSGCPGRPVCRAQRWRWADVPQESTVRWRDIIPDGRPEAEVTTVVVTTSGESSPSRFFSFSLVSVMPSSQHSCGCFSDKSTSLFVCVTLEVPTQTCEQSDDKRSEVRHRSRFMSRLHSWATSISFPVAQSHLGLIGRAARRPCEGPSGPPEHHRSAVDGMALAAAASDDGAPWHCGDQLRSR